MELVCTPCPCSKVEAIVQTPDPEMCNIEIIFGIRELLLKVCPKSGHDTSPLESVAQAWWWTSECADAFKQVKEALASSQVLAHYDPKLLIKMAADASSYEIGAVVSHVYPDGSERPIAFTSRTLSKSGQNYAQLEKEALSLVYGCLTFSSISIWKMFHVGDRSQTDTESTQRYSFISGSQVTMMGNHFFSISVPDWVQVHQGPWKCWQTL